MDVEERAVWKHVVQRCRESLTEDRISAQMWMPTTRAMMAILAVADELERLERIEAAARAYREAVEDDLTCTRQTPIWRCREMRERLRDTQAALWSALDGQAATEKEKES